LIFKIQAGGETTGNGVVIALRPGRSAGPKHGDEKFRSSRFRPAPLPGCEPSALGSGGFTTGLYPQPFQGKKQQSPNAKVFGNDKR